ncbi:MAG: hypothetical protein OXU69_00985 [Gemmatimonadota bacterium]|nr:hypothetical protein [Gemmatimonadota bacterium]MDE2983249.1 hypothetical protein [Gemmatimonadota bacterium]
MTPMEAECVLPPVVGSTDTDAPLDRENEPRAHSRPEEEPRGVGERGYGLGTLKEKIHADDDEDQAFGSFGEWRIPSHREAPCDAVMGEKTKTLTLR